MKTLSNLIGKPIISIYNGQIEGYVKNLLFDKKLTKVVFLQFFDDNTQEEKLLQTKTIYKFGQDAIIIKNDSEVIIDTVDISNYINPINLEVYSLDGNKKGKIVDVALNECKVDNLILQNNKVLAINNVLNVGKNVVILKNELKKVKITDFKNKTKFVKVNSNIKVEMQNGSTIITPQKPKKILTNNIDFLIGRKTNKNIYADNGELIVKKQTKVTSSIIDIVCKYGKLKELTSNSII